MSALAKIEAAGFVVGLEDGMLSISPASKLTQKQREFLKKHKVSIIDELQKESQLCLSDEAILHLIVNATDKTQITSKQFWLFCSDEDIEDIRAGRYTSDELKAYAQSWSEHADAVPICNSQPYPGEADTNGDPVTCGQCIHFMPDEVGNGSGFGNCGKELTDGPAHWPGKERHCESYQSKGESICG